MSAIPELKSMFGSNIPETSAASDANALAEKQNKEAEEKKVKDYLKKQSKR